MRLMRLARELSGLRMSIYALSFVTQSYHGVNPCRPAGGKIRGGQRNNQQDCEGTGDAEEFESLGAVKQGINQATQGVRQGQTQQYSSSHENRDIFQNQAADKSRVGAEGHSNSDLARALGDAVGQQAVDSDGGKQHRQSGEYSSKIGNEEVGSELSVDLLSKSSKIGD